MGNLGYQEVLILMIGFVFIILLFLIFWKFPAIMKKLGRGVREYQDAKNKVPTKSQQSTDDKASV